MQGRDGGPMIDLLKTQYWSFENLRDLQTERMRYIVRYAYNNIKGYNELYNKYGISIDSISELEDLERLPVVTRADLQEYDKWINKEQVFTNMRTGGSTGEPLIYHECIEAKEMRAQKHNRGWLWSGYNQSTDRRAIVCSARGSTGKGSQILNIDGGVEKKDIKGVLDKIKDFDPVQIRAYVSTALILARWITKNNYYIEIPSINLIAEQLYPEDRITIEEAFLGDVFEEYVCCDGGSSAWDCENKSGMHETMERAIIENDKDGNMIVTDLWNKASPFIRYINGDKIKRLDKPCSCGRQLPLIRVQGRDNDIIKLPSGSYSPSFILHHISHAKTSENKFLDYKAFQIIQEDEESLIVNITKGAGYTELDEETLLDVVYNICKTAFIKINYVDSLEKSISGKLKFIINKVKND